MWVVSNYLHRKIEALGFLKIDGDDACGNLTGNDSSDGFASMKCITTIYGMSDGEWTWYLSLVDVEK